MAGGPLPGRQPRVRGVGGDKNKRRDLLFGGPPRTPSPRGAFPGAGRQPANYFMPVQVSGFSVMTYTTQRPQGDNDYGLGRQEDSIGIFPEQSKKLQRCAVPSPSQCATLSRPRTTFLLGV